MLNYLQDATNVSAHPVAVSTAPAANEAKALLALEAATQHEAIAGLKDVHWEGHLGERHCVQYEQWHRYVGLQLLLLDLFPPTLVSVMRLDI